MLFNFFHIWKGFFFYLIYVQNHKKSARARAATASYTGTALGTIHGSWRPPTVIVVFSFVSKSTVACSLEIVGVGFTATSKTIGATVPPTEMPPRMPPQRLVFSCRLSSKE